MKTFLKPLNADEEKSYMQKYKEGDQEAKHVLIERNLRLVAHIVKKYQSVEDNMEDLISIGTIGLIKAVDTFNYEKGNRLVTYAARCIENELLMMFRSKKKTSKEVSLYEPIGTDKEGNAISLLDVLESQDKDVVEEISSREHYHKLYELLPRVLEDREQEIIAKRYGLFGRKEKTQREIALEMGISRSYVSRIEKKALKKLRTEFERSGE